MANGYSSMLNNGLNAGSGIHRQIRDPTPDPGSNAGSGIQHIMNIEQDKKSNVHADKTMIHMDRNETN